MSTLKVLHEISLYDDTESSNNPEQVRLKYSLDNEEILSSDYRMDLVLAAATTTAIPLPSATYNWLYVLTDQEVSLRISGLSTDQILVSPSAAGERDGIYLVRGNFTSLSVRVAGATAANVFILAGITEA